MNCIVEVVDQDETDREAEVRSEDLDAHEVEVQNVEEEDLDHLNVRDQRVENVKKQDLKFNL